MPTEVVPGYRRPAKLAVRSVRSGPAALESPLSERQDRASAVTSPVPAPSFPPLCDRPAASQPCGPLGRWQPASCTVCISGIPSEGQVYVDRPRPASDPSETW